MYDIMTQILQFSLWDMRNQVENEETTVTYKYKSCLVGCRWSFFAVSVLLRTKRVYYSWYIRTVNAKVVSECHRAIPLHLEISIPTI